MLDYENLLHLLQNEMYVTNAELLYASDDRAPVLQKKLKHFNKVIELVRTLKNLK